ncbi:MAG: fasciclin domain-containing protein [Anaerolineales bacterium]|nr:fasciclin domain-containing protein [Anaerolineales bacterium]
MRKKLKAVSFIVMLVWVALLAPLTLAAPPEQTESQKGIVDMATEQGQFTTLVAALEQAGLVDRLQGEGPFTVFAPTDEAFAKLPEGTLEDLFANQQALTDLLLYHIVEGRLAAADVIQQESFEALTGQALTITTQGETVMVNGAEVITPDLTGSNGVIHVIDTVLMPPTGELVTGTGDAVMDDSATAPGGTTPAEVTAAGCAENYVVQASDSLSQIAAKYLGDPLAFSQIVEATNAAAAGNQTYAAIDDPDLIEVGQTICIPGSAEAVATTTTGEDAATPQDAATTAADQITAVPEGKAIVIFENFSFVDLVFDLSGPTPDSLVIPPDGKQEFILEPGQYTYHAHQPGGDFSVAPGTFELEAGQAITLSCSDSPTCAMQGVAPEQIPAAKAGQS